MQAVPGFGAATGSFLLDSICLVMQVQEAGQMHSILFSGGRPEEGHQCSRFWGCFWQIFVGQPLPGDAGPESWAHAQQFWCQAARPEEGHHCSGAQCGDMDVDHAIFRP